ncbi:ribosome biogenesis/translation initiation ATPase RLI [Candidatus Woesearchaeota archaeon]|nr:ribosome biogenesis/translation initiation ATPase RLI [Candidatus Woesearchaeota archaeon]
MTRIAVVDNSKLKDMDKKKHIQSLCPVNRSGSECIKLGDSKLSIDESLCIGCGICVNAAPDSIKIINLPESLTKDPIHRYGENQFSLYNLPTPIFGKVTGILGVNGIGKTTAINILAGVLNPNLGDWEKEADHKQLIEFFKGTEAQLFFEKVEKGDIKVSYKPQNVDMIPKTSKGKVRTLLEKVDEKKELEKISKELEIEKILDNDIKNISGGELQRVAIAATILKKANVYIFDEPTSYLDIKQRIKVSKFIRNMVNNETAVLVVEHDLIILDYMTDLVYIMYGKESGFGVVSQPKSTKTAINVYLSGYLKEENVRFRDHEIKFEVRPPTSLKKQHLLTTWHDIKKKLGNFNLEADKGELHKNEVIGVLGENGIGKTSFVKILAGVLKQDKGKIETKIVVSYKPQYLETSNELVMNILKEAVKNYETQIIRPLNIKPLLLKKITQLSGGELQRVSIALCLSKEADLYLIDEPSAYLDAEQRLIVSKIIRGFIEEKNKTALIVDHDLLFMDYLSEKLIVFDGESAVNGVVNNPLDMEKGMNKFLNTLQITFRRDEESKRPRANKLDSQMDKKQKSENKLYYT